MTRTLVTGATGFIGRHLVRHLVACGHEVTVAIRPTSNTAPLDTLDIHEVHADLLDAAALELAVKRADLVFHVAGAISAFSRRALVRTNGVGTRNLVRACARQENPPIVTVVSSIAAAGPQQRGRVRTEADQPQPASNYGWSKRAGERAAERYADRVPITVVRPGVVFGPEDQSTLKIYQPIRDWGIHVLPSWKSPRLSYIEVNDLARLLQLAASKGQRLAPARQSQSPDQGYYFACAAEYPDYIELGRMVQRALGRRHLFLLRLPRPIAYTVAGVNELIGRWKDEPQTVCIDKIREATSPDWACSPAKAARDLQFSTSKPLEDQVASTIAWYRQSGLL